MGLGFWATSMDCLKCKKGFIEYYDRKSMTMKKKQCKYCRGTTKNKY